MRSYGTAQLATTCDRPIPLPTTPRHREEDHITARMERRRAFVSPIVLHNPEEFTADQLRAAGFTIAGDKPKRVHPGHTPPADTARIVTMYEAGETVAAISAAVGVHVTTVRRHLADTRTPLRTRTRTPTPTAPPVDVDVMRDLYTVQGLYVAQIAGRLGVPLRTVERAMADAGLTREDRASVPRPNPVVTLMDANGVTAADVRAWAKTTGHECPPRGYPPKHLVEAYLLTRALSTTHTTLEGTA